MSRTRMRLVVIALVCMSGCTGPGMVAYRAAGNRPFAEGNQGLERPQSSEANVALRKGAARSEQIQEVAYSKVPPSVGIQDASMQPVVSQTAAYEIPQSLDNSSIAEEQPQDSTALKPNVPQPESQSGVIDPSGTEIDEIFELPSSRNVEQTVPLNLPSVLAAIDSQHPIVGQAQWRVRQAYAQLEQARVLWLPSIQAGFSFHRHDGNYQASNGDIVDVNRNSFQYGLGAGATGAGTTNTRPGVVAQFHLADAVFLPKVAEKNAWAEGHAANAARNQQLRTAAASYFGLLDAHQDLRIVEQSRMRFSELTDITVDFAETGQGLNADADRLRTELALIDSRLLRAEERVAVATAELAQAISLNADGTIVPTDVNAVPLDLVHPGADRSSLVATALRTRPELKESQALVAAACEAFQREKMAPFVPSFLLGFSTGGFGGGLGDDLDNIDDRYDFDALLSWELRNLGFGEAAARREQSARVQQARFEKLRVLDQVAREVNEAYAQVQFRSRQIEITRRAIQNAENSHRRNLERIRDGQGLPLEVLQSVEALESAQRAYLRAVIDYNQAQIQLQWALGFPVA